jgi:hypothetical protein
MQLNALVHLTNNSKYIYSEENKMEKKELAQLMKEKQMIIIGKQIDIQIKSLEQQIESLKQLRGLVDDLERIDKSSS